MDIGSREVVILAIAFFLLFGSKSVPTLAKGIKKSVRHVRDALKDDDISPPLTKS
jgi:Sec-independent protein translocase protein TatA